MELIIKRQSGNFMNNGSVLVSGASFAGLATAFWMARAGYAVTVVEIAPELRKGGTPVNIKGDTIGIVDRMGLLEAISANRIEKHTVELWSRSGPIAADTSRLPPDADHSSEEGIEYEIERDALTGLLFNLVADHIEIIFSESIVRLEEQPDGVGVEFRRSARRTFDLVLGCDGIHSNVRKLWFGEETDYAHFLKTYGSVTIVPRLLVGEGTMSVYQTPGKMVVLTAYHGKTDIVALFTSNDRIEYDRQNRAQQTALVADHLGGEGWRVPELIEEIEEADYFYFSDLSQIHMPDWTKGRVGLVGDAAFCASAAAGMGGSLAINGAAALGTAFASCDGDYVTAFATYNESFRASVEAVQGDAVAFCKGIEAGQTF
ncbi:FAD-binding monooxygenase [Agrobacterium vitis]|nr:FAD-binding monooxygenase [Agrobacterium vitis]